MHLSYLSVYHQNHKISIPYTHTHTHTWIFLGNIAKLGVRWACGGHVKGGNLSQHYAIIVLAKPSLPPSREMSAK